MHALAVCRFPLPGRLARHTCWKWHCRHGPRSFASSTPSRPSPSCKVHDDQSRGGLPRFYCPDLPSSKGNMVRVQDDEFWHMAKVLRLGLNDRVELFNGLGGLIEGYIQKIDRTGLDFVALEDMKIISPRSVQWHVFAAFGSLKGGRADWLVEKCTELGAFSVTPLLTTRSLSIAENRLDRLQRVSLAATKQCQRLHKMILNPPLKLSDLLPKEAQTLRRGSRCRPGHVSDTDMDTRCTRLRSVHFFLKHGHNKETTWTRHGQLGHDLDTLRTRQAQIKSLYKRNMKYIAESRNAFLAEAGAPALFTTLNSLGADGGGLLVIGPEGDFTEEEAEMLTKAGATSIGLGPCRLRVETAAIALLSALMLYSDSQVSSRC